MGELESFSRLVERFSSVADFVFVYIAEAHPFERGHFEGNFNIETHQRLADRLSAASILRSEVDARFPLLKKVDILVDEMNDAANWKFAAAPERLVVVLDGVVRYMSGATPLEYKIEEVERWLEELEQER